MISAIFWSVLSFIIGTSTAQSCEAGCQREINAVMDYASNLHTQLGAANDNIDSLFKRVAGLETDYYDQIDRLINRMSTLENHLAQNVTALRNLVYEETGAVFNSLSERIESEKRDMTNRVNNLTVVVNYLQDNWQSNAGNAGQMLDLYSNITRRINDLEFGKIQNLSVDNLIWRKNFRAVNSTFERMKKNNCLC